MEQADLVGTRRSMTGEVLPPRLPVTASAVAAGEIGAGQLRVITETMAALPAGIPGPVRERVEADLAGYARDFDPRRLRTIAQRVVATLDPDGTPPEDSPPGGKPRGELWLRRRRDGQLGFEGWLNAEYGALFAAMIEQGAGTTAPDDGSDTLRGVGGDERSLPARQADALIELIEQARAADAAPLSAAGEPPHLTVTMDLDALRTALGAATLDHGHPISARDARRLA